MTAGTTRETTLNRVAPSGAPVELTIPDAFGAFRWYGSTRVVGPRTQRQFFLAPAGEHRAVPTHVLRGASERRQPMRGFDAIVFEAPDRSDSALVLAGPHHEATTWFGGPAPDAAGVASLLDALRFTDSPDGATLVPAPGSPLTQPDVSIIGRSEEATLILRRSLDVLATLPEFAGLRLAGGELWRAARGLDQGSATRVAGGPHEWRYVLAGPSLAMDLVLLGPESGRAATAMDEDAVLDALGRLSGRWRAVR